MAELKGYLAAEGFEEELIEELGGYFRERHGRMILSYQPPRDPFWAQNTWENPEFLEISSINDAAKKLRSKANLWTLWPHLHHRRAHLIEQNLPKLKLASEFAFLNPLPSKPLSAWMMLDQNRLLVSSKTSSPLKHGEIKFKENKILPPSRAYLKLWELFTVYGFHPGKDERAVDAGACPGGWTWVLAELGCQVISVDKAPLDPKIASYKNVRTLKKDAFELKPQEIGETDWFFSDIICEPKRLESLIMNWLDSGLCRNFVCTIKFKGKTDHLTAERLSRIPGAQVRHLYHNKHELTWWLVRDVGQEKTK